MFNPHELSVNRSLRLQGRHIFENELESGPIRKMP
jgi:hypothetical protein